jgi:hypothetical protein
MMLEDKLLDAVLNHWSTVSTAPVPFVAMALFALGLGWWARKAWDQRHLALWKDLATNAGPIEVADRIEQIKAALVELQSARGRIITLSQKKRFADAVSKLSKKTELPVHFHVINFDPECENYARNLAQLFEDNGFSVSAGPRQRPNIPSNRGILLVVADPNNLTQDARVVASLLTKIGIDYRIIGDPARIPHPQVFSIVVGSDPQG